MAKAARDSHICIPHNHKPAFPVAVYGLDGLGFLSAACVGYDLRKLRPSDQIEDSVSYKSAVGEANGDGEHQRFDGPGHPIVCSSATRVDDFPPTRLHTPGHVLSTSNSALA